MDRSKQLWVDKIPYLNKLKSFFSGINYKEINLWPIMANDSYTFYKNQDRKFSERMSLIARFILFRENFNIDYEKEKNKILATYFMPREDHHELTKNALSKFSNEELFFLDAYEHKKNPYKKYSFSFPNPFLLLKVWWKFKKAGLKQDLDKYYWLFIARTYQRYKQINYFDKMINRLNPKGYIAFCSQAFGEESVITLICKRDKIPTFTLQHGLVVVYPDFSPVSILNENIISDYLLIWGKSTRDIQKKYVDESRLLIAGNPKYTQLNLIKHKENSSNKGLILFPVTGYDKSKTGLIKIVKELVKNHPEIEIYISVHPFDNLKDYEKEIIGKNVNFIEKGVKITDYFEKCDFVILHNTTLAMEALNYSIPIFRYKDEFLVSLWKNDDFFRDERELENLIKKMKDKKTFHRWLDKYEEELIYNFYFDEKKSVPEMYYEKIMGKLK